MQPRDLLHENGCQRPGTLVATLDQSPSVRTLPKIVRAVPGHASKPRLLQPHDGRRGGAPPGTRMRVVAPAVGGVDLAGLDAVLDAITDPVLLTGAGGRLLVANTGARRLFVPEGGRTNGFAAGRANWARLTSFLAELPPDGAEPVRGELRLVNPADGSELVFELISTVVGGTRHGRNVVSILHDRSDVTEKSRFLANMSHEFRTPLNAMLGYTSMLLQGVAGPLESGAKRKLRRIESNGRHLLTIINEILDISRIEAGRMPLQISRFALSGVVAEVVAELEPIIMRSKLPVTVDVPADVSAIRSDRQKVKQILLNLLSNALKFTHKGGVTISVRPSPRRTLGLALGRRHRHRHRGGRSGADLRRLPAARQLADARVRRHRPRPVDLPPAGADARRPDYDRQHSGKGIDLHAGAADPETPMSVRGARPLVLLVDDYPDAREMYSEYLRFSGFDVVEAGNGMEALQRAADSAPDVILMDLSLPVMDGWEATRRLKADRDTTRIPIVALTGHALAGISEGARKAGCDAFVTKPCLPEDLVKEIRKVLERG